MVKSCCVFGCTNRANSVAKEKKISFYRFPIGIHKKRAWIRAINRKDWKPTPFSYVCSAHFVDGWHSDDKEDVNYAPTVFSYKKKEHDQERFERAFRRDVSKTFKEAAAKQKEREDAIQRLSLTMHSYSTPDNPETDLQSDQEAACPVLQFEDDIGVSFKTDQGCQCDPDYLLLENQKLREEVDVLRQEINKIRFGVDKIRDDDNATKFYTGLPTFAVFMWLFRYLQPKAARMNFWNGKRTAKSDRQKPMKIALPLIDQFLAVLIRLKVGLYIQDISDRFSISPSCFSNIFNTWISLLYTELQVLNHFPSKQLVQQKKPECFKNHKNLRVILDCTEIFIQRSSSLINQNLTFSNYKHHNTLKFLIGITPAGVISFVSEAYGGRISDRQIVIDSGLLDLLDPGDDVMADKGFIIRDLLEERQCTLNIPPFRNKNMQFTVEEVLSTQEIAKLRIHVERNIGRVKTFHIFDGVMPLSLAPIASKCFSVACWLTNLDVPMV